MNSIRDALLKSFDPRIVVTIKTIDEKSRIHQGVFDDVKASLQKKYNIYADTNTSTIYISGLKR